MPFSFDTKPNLNNRKFEQLSSECLNFSGTTSIFGSLCVIPTGIIDSFSGYKLSGYTFLDSSHICISSVFVGANSGANNRGYNEIAIGYNSLYNSCGNSNIAVGCNSLCSNTTGVGNIGIGVNTLLSSVSNSYNIAIGDNSLCTNNGGIYNIGLGYNTLKSNTIGCNNIGIGLEALKSNIGGKFNIGLGYKVLTNNTCGENNVGVGDSVLYCNISGNTNVGVGVNVLYNNKGGCSNTGIGNNVLYLNTFGQANTSIGYNSLSSNTIGCYNNAFGCGTLKSNISGCYNIGFGDRALYANTCGCLNIAMGSNALSGNTLGVSNIGIGNNSLQKNLTGNYNLGIGENTLCCNTTGCYNMAFGYNTLLNNNTGCNNVGIGYNILRTNTTGCNNLGLGYNVLYNNTTGCNNIALGFCTLCCNTIGLNNIGIGYGSLKTNTDGCGNISIGCFNLYNNVSGSNNVSIGTCAGYAETGSNKFYVANNATYNLIYGEFDNNIITLPKLKLCETPTTGAGTDSLLVWNSTDKCVKKIANNTIIGELVTGATSSTDNAIARFDGITGKLIQNSGIIIDDNGNMGFGVTPTSQITQKSTIEMESPRMSDNLLNNSNWTSVGWTGDFINGFTHVVGNVNTLSNSLIPINNSIYLIEYNITSRTAGSISIGFGGNIDNNIRHSGYIGNRTINIDNLTITPTSDFNGKVIISIKSITGESTPSYVIKNRFTNYNDFEIRSTNYVESNTFIGINSGSYITFSGINNTGYGAGSLRYNTTGSLNSAQGAYALNSNTTGNYNTAQGAYALNSNTTGNYNSAQGASALNSNTTGNYNTAQGASALSNNTTGNYNTAQGYCVLVLNTSGHDNTTQGAVSLYFNTTGCNNTAQGSNSLNFNTTGCNNTAQGSKSLNLNTTGCNNIGIGYNAGKYIANGVNGNCTGNNNIFLGANTKVKLDGDVNEIVIGYNAIGEGSNSIVLGNTNILNSYLRGNVILSTTPSTGSVGDSYLVWNSTDKCIKSVSCSSIISGATITANNGLTKSGTNVRLGGALTGNTGISGAYTMGFSNSILNLTGSTCVNISGPTKLLSTPGTGASTDGILVWNSTDKTIKQVSSVSCATNATTAVNSTCLNGQLASYYAVGTHVHGNITNGGCLGTISGCVLVTTTGGLITTASSVSCATNATTANNSTCLNGQLASYYATATHAHGNITNGGCLGTTSGCVLVTTTGGLITTASSVTCATNATTANNSTCLNGQLASYYAVASNVVCSANNGLTKSGSNVRLGGALTGNTTIGGTYLLNINDNIINVNNPYYTHNRPLIYYNCFYNSYYIGSEGALGSNTVGLGYSVLNTSVDVGDGNTAIGGFILCNNVTGIQNVGVGTQIMGFGETLCYNIGIGDNVLQIAEDSCYNIGIGIDVLHINKGHNNIAIGAQALSNLNNCNINDNIAIGVCSGIDSAGNNSVYIGQCAGFGNQDSNRLYIANNGACALIYGEFDNNIVRLPYLKLCNAPSTGVDTDQLLTWNSTDCCVKSINNTFSSLWKSINASRASNTTITVDTGANDGTIIFTKGLIIKWTDGGVTKCGMVVSSTYSNPNTMVTIIGDVCSATAYGFSYSLLPVEIIRFALAGNIGVTGTDVANAYYANYPLRVIGADIQVGTIGTPSSTNTTVDINKGGTTMFTVKPTLTSSATVTTPFTANNSVSLALNDKVTIDIDAVQTTAAVDLYVQLYVVQIRLLNMN